MSVVHVNFFSQSLARGTDFYAVLPDDMPPMMCQGNPHFRRPMKTLYLLHGYSGNATDWITGCPVRELSGKYNLCIVMPNGDNSFYVDGAGVGSAYGTYVGEELVTYTRKLFGLSDKREDTFIGGYSMGGFGAIRNGLQFADTFEKLIGLSNALIIEGLKDMGEDFDNGLADYAYYHRTFGDLKTAELTDKNPRQIVKDRKAGGKRLPDIFLACGTEDFLYMPNKAFREFLTEEQVPFTYLEDKGEHNWSFWNRCMEPAIQWMLGETEEVK